MKRLFIALFFVFIPLVLNAQNINGRLSSSFYTFERFDAATTSETYLRTFQSIMLNVNEGQFSLRTRINLETDLMTSLDSDPRLRFYNLYFEGRNLFDIATIKVGRQSLFNSVAGGLFDGVNLKFKYEDFALTGFYGGNVPAYQKLELTDSWEEDYVMGGKFETTALQNFRFAVSYIDKNFKAENYSTLRLDENLDPINMEIRKKSNQYKFVSAEASFAMAKFLNVFTRFDYDLNFRKASKFEISGRYEQIENLGINLYYNYREPRITYNSIFSVFNYGNTQEIEAGVDYKVNKLITVSGKFGNVTFDDDNSQRLTLGLNSNLGSINYRKTFGYAGELDAVSLYTAHSFLSGFVTPSIGVSYTIYKLSPDAEENSLMSLLAGINVRPWRALSFDIQTQYMNNKIYKNDFRALLKINYWFNTNLDLL